MLKFFNRFTGVSYGSYKDFNDDPGRYGGKLSAHIESTWTSPEHFAHNNYQRGHLPQLCIIASGWKARLLSLIFWTDPIHVDAPKKVIWNKNGDHPYDNVWRSYEDTGKTPTEPREGEVVRYFRHPNIDGKSICNKCNHKMNDHGWIDCGGIGITVCPGTELLY